ncbi:hypothetical protein ABD87_22930 [Lysinibacillus sphaericus]|uniref:hypothetical protein n=1 Tax=Lysinibacillus sphaericus TaxID=1421 RepID=UPI0018CE5422|nr:hypothetical protein [Lysinibacillus sphaericus]MBG9732283.1 hypothetical protein [Lysinibacillus sphaericus]
MQNAKNEQRRKEVESNKSRLGYRIFHITLFLTLIEIFLTYIFGYLDYTSLGIFLVLIHMGIYWNKYCE